MYVRVDMDPTVPKPGSAEKKEVVISDFPVQAVVVYPDRAEVGVRLVFASEGVGWCIGGRLTYLLMHTVTR